MRNGNRRRGAPSWFVADSFKAVYVYVNVDVGVIVDVDGFSRINEKFAHHNPDCGTHLTLWVDDASLRFSRA